MSFCAPRKTSKDNGRTRACIYLYVGDRLITVMELRPLDVPANPITQQLVQAQAAISSRRFLLRSCLQTARIVWSALLADRLNAIRVANRFPRRRDPNVCFRPAHFCFGRNRFRASRNEANGQREFNANSAPFIMNDALTNDKTSNLYLRSVDEPNCCT